MSRQDSIKSVVEEIRDANKVLADRLILVESKMLHELDQIRLVKERLTNEQAKVDKAVIEAQRLRDDAVEELRQEGIKHEKAKAELERADQVSKAVNEEKERAELTSSKLAHQKAHLDRTQADLSKRIKRLEFDERDIIAKRIELERFARDKEIEDYISGEKAS